jgi:hypothetical protein
MGRPVPVMTSPHCLVKKNHRARTCTGEQLNLDPSLQKFDCLSDNALFHISFNSKGGTPVFTTGLHRLCGTLSRKKKIETWQFIKFKLMERRTSQRRNDSNASLMERTNSQRRKSEKSLDNINIECSGSNSTLYSKKPQVPPSPISNSSNSSLEESFTEHPTIGRRRSTTSISSTISITDTVNGNKKRNRHMHQHFEGQIPHDQVCIADFSCALMLDYLLRQGRLYITSEHLLFHSPIKNTKIIFHISKIKQLVPRTTLFFPTALDIVLDDRSIQLKSLFYRQNTIHCIQAIQNHYSNMGSVRECNGSEKLTELVSKLPLKVVKKRSWTLIFSLVCLFVFLAFNALLIIKSFAL